MGNSIGMKKRFAIIVCFLCVSLAGCENSHVNEEKEIPQKQPAMILNKGNIQTDINNTHNDFSKSCDIEEKEEFDAEIGEEKEEKYEAVYYEETENEVKDWVSSLKVAVNTNQILAVIATGNTARVEYYEKIDDEWTQIINTSGNIGNNGLGKTKEGDKKTPRGIYGFTMAFGAKENPGTKLNYVQVNQNNFWVDDSNSVYYNKMVDVTTVQKDWNSAEKLYINGKSYNYALATSYNLDCVPGKGSAIFVHCLPTAGYGCIAIPEDQMKLLLTKVSDQCVLIIDDENGILNY